MPGAAESTVGASVPQPHFQTTNLARTPRTPFGPGPLFADRSSLYKDIHLKDDHQQLYWVKQDALRIPWLLQKTGPPKITPAAAAHAWGTGFLTGLPGGAGPGSFAMPQCGQAGK